VDKQPKFHAFLFARHTTTKYWDDDAGAIFLIPSTRLNNKDSSRPVMSSSPVLRAEVLLSMSIFF